MLPGLPVLNYHIDYIDYHSDSNRTYASFENKSTLSCRYMLSKSLISQWDLVLWIFHRWT